MHQVSKILFCHETLHVSWQIKILDTGCTLLVIYTKIITMHGHLNVRYHSVGRVPGFALSSFWQQQYANDDVRIIQIGGKYDTKTEFPPQRKQNPSPLQWPNYQCCLGKSHTLIKRLCRCIQIHSVGKEFMKVKVNGTYNYFFVYFWTQNKAIHISVSVSKNILWNWGK